MRLTLGLSRRNRKSAAGVPAAELADGPASGSTTDIAVDGARKRSGGRVRKRLLMTVACFVGIYGVIGGKLIYFGMIGGTQEDTSGPAIHELASRPDILDRNGQILATDIKTYSLYAEPRKISDPDETVEMLSTVLPDLDFDSTYKRLKSHAGFVWIKRGLTPKQQSQIMALGVPGVGFRTEKRRFYPDGSVASHILGLVNVDNQGIAGMEKYIDSQGLTDLRSAGMATGRSLEPVRLSIDIRVQQVVHDVLVDAMQRYKAIAAGAVVLNVKTGEVLAMASLPDYDPNDPVHALDKDRLNRMTAGTFEMGSVIKSFTTAMALDSGKFNLNSMLDARHPEVFGHMVIHDFHAKNRWLTLPEVFIYSSNIGSGHEAAAIGIAGHRAFLHKMGLLDRMQTELPEVARPVEPRVWKTVNSMTIAFGHGLAVAPIQALAAVTALVNGGYLMKPTFLKRSQEEAMKVATRVIKPETSEALRFIMRINGEKGSARKADIPGYFVGGKTGTAEKVINGRYAKNKNFTTFTAIVPSDKPRYLFLTIYDEPKGYAESGGYSTAAWNGGVTTGKLIERAAPLLGIVPRFDPPPSPFPLMAKLGAWGSR